MADNLNPVNDMPSAYPGLPLRYAQRASLLPPRLHHVARTDVPLPDFMPLSHFGTAKAAFDRLRRGHHFVVLGGKLLSLRDPHRNLNLR